MLASLPRDMDFREAHERKLIYFAKLEALDGVARSVASALKRRSSRFNVETFLRACGVENSLCSYGTPYVPHGA